MDDVLRIAYCVVLIPEYCSLFTVHCSLFTVHCSLFTVYSSIILTGEKESMATEAQSMAFDPDMVARLEASGWKAYYAHEWVRALLLLIRMAQEQFHIAFPKSLLAAFYT